MQTEKEREQGVCSAIIIFHCLVEAVMNKAVMLSVVTTPRVGKIYITSFLLPPFNMKNCSMVSKQT